MKPLNKRMVANYRRGIRPRRIVLLLTTIGRKSGLKRVTPLQYEEIDNVLYVVSARGANADWVRNLQANPRAHVQLQQQEFEASAELISDAGRIVDFFELRLHRHPIMIRLIMHLFDGLPLHFQRADLERLAGQKILVVLRRWHSSANRQTK
jgi:deazaflavin-dependent oxidoreductase (nitroreductase family)